MTNIVYSFNVKLVFQKLIDMEYREYLRLRSSGYDRERAESLHKILVRAQTDPNLAFIQHKG